MNWQVVHTAHVSPSPWRNGGGVTRELALWPDADHWSWRMSVAEVERSGPFSHFEGVQRWFAVLGGAGVRLNVDGQIHHLTRDSEPFAFDGAAAVACELIDGATQDFNLMLRGARSARLQRLVGDCRFVLNSRSIVAVYAIDADATLELGGKTIVLPAQSLAWQPLPGGAVVRASAANAL